MFLVAVAILYVKEAKAHTWSLSNKCPIQLFAGIFYSKLKHRFHTLA